MLARLTASFANVSMSVMLCDGQARVVQRQGGDRHLLTHVDLTHLDEVIFAPGFCGPEAAAGINGIGTAFTERRPVHAAA